MRENSYAHHSVNSLQLTTLLSLSFGTVGLGWVLPTDSQSFTIHSIPFPSFGFLFFSQKHKAKKKKKSKLCFKLETFPRDFAPRIFTPFIKKQTPFSLAGVIVLLNCSFSVRLNLKMASSIGIMDSAYFVGRNEILNWINNRLQLNLSRIEEVTQLETFYFVFKKWACFLPFVSLIEYVFMP